MAALITQISYAVENGALDKRVTVRALRRWVMAYHIVKDNGRKYASGSIGSILSKSDRKNRHSSTTNARLVQSRLNEDGKREYWFDPPVSHPNRRSKADRARDVINSLIRAGYFEERIARRHRPA